VESLLVMAVLIVLAAFGLPALERMLARSKLQGSAREIAVHLGSGRVAAMRLGRNVVVRPDYDRGGLLSFVDEDEDFTHDAGEQELSWLTLPESGGNRGVFMMGPDGVAGTDADPAMSVSGLTAIPGESVKVAVLRSDGSIRNPGGFRVSDGRERANVFEVRIDPSATARIELLKFVYDDVTGINPLPDPPGSWFPQGGNAWEWYR
jgi:hypothetical protein